MSGFVNAYGQPIGSPLSGWTPPAVPGRTPLEGRYCRLEPLDAGRDGETLYQALCRPECNARWTYLPYGPFEDPGDWRQWLHSAADSVDPLFFVVQNRSDMAPSGLASYLRITPVHGVIEIGHLNFGPGLQRTPAATEALFLMVDQAFTGGYRRCEWKCDALNAASRSSALRLGFTFEGIFRQAIVTKGRSRDSAWYSILDCEWPALREQFLRWLAPENFDESGRQKGRLTEWTAAIRAGRATPS